MAFPVVEATNTSAESGTPTNHTIALPAGITAGDLLIVAFGYGGSGTGRAFAGWTEVVVGRYSVWVRIADGSEGATATLVTDAGRQSAHNSYRISGQFVSGTLSDIVVAADASATFDPPNLAPGWGALDILWLVGAGTRRTDGTFTAAPSNFTDLLQIPSSGSSSSDQTVRQASARRNLNAASLDPGAFTYSGTANANAVWTLAVRPAAGAIEVAVGQAIEQETANPFTPVINREVAVGTAVEVEAANTIDPQVSRRVDVGQAAETELAQPITPVIGRMVAVGQATEAETANGITPVIRREVLVGQAVEVELARTISPVKPIFVPVQTAVERELARMITPQLGQPFLPGVECEVIALPVACSVVALPVSCATIALGVECEVME